jgi:hypothetical protein
LEQTPPHSALAEPGACEAAFERARRKLAATRGSTVQLNTTRWWKGPGARGGLALAAAMLGALMIIQSLSGRVVLSESDWPVRYAYVMAVAFGAGLLTWLAMRLWQSWRSRSADDPVSVLDEFFLRVSNPKSREDLHELVIKSDFDGNGRVLPRHIEPSPARAGPIFKAGYLWNELEPGAVLHEPTRADTPDKAKVAPPGLMVYWGRIAHRKKPWRSHFSLGNSEVRFLAADVALVDFTLKERERFVPGDFMLATGGGMASALFGIGLDKIDPVIQTLVAYGLGILAAILNAGLPAPWQEKHRLRKLVVRSGRGWKLFSGDWQTPDETDLSWLDSGPTQEPHTSPEPALVEAS